ncbi:16S rRNA (guanine(966)-N(2))-methyltransferase RsmD [Aerococcus kribbianus]|uniref:16S rRNA (Guanine(966)-N(2))-methyltransferase RsmD n=1 Tax=Aerococcus kribbianus TaxID=2999064 RepID=A0A9X3FPK4_9LACT|nr:MULTISPECIES: 16S rRNA (guanine(966)-N(2))-methyltransferase RsmD [unclassified Aerococcus]MCZ0717226.1 16S rRNA (guanine(966)-N(2))-methyltransferase RsmD [Aerococcus sp. YH-aer221]MCZ0725514.1 16S rRNA (guanine(966)-N(2))-methyltransferase RsmD [Aerococcus sp. YH-aer222]
MRIIAGQYGKRRLKAVPGKNTRPTTDKIKESLFNIIGPYFSEETRVLDLYAGSGALGIEALSRGAGQLVACERHRAAITTIKENINDLGIQDQVSLLTGDNRKTLSDLRQKDRNLSFDLVFLDPPYKQQKLVETIQALVADAWLSDHVLLVCEMDKHDTMPETIAGLEKTRDQVYGITRLVFYQWPEED